MAYGGHPDHGLSGIAGQHSAGTGMESAFGGQAIGVPGGAPEGQHEMGAFLDVMTQRYGPQSVKNFVDNSSFIRFAQGGSAAAYRMKNGGTTLNITLSEGFGTSKAIAEVSRDGSDGVRVLKDGASLGTGSGAGTFAFQQVGTSSNGVTSGEIHEVVVFGAQLSSADATLVRNNIATRCSITL